MRIGIITTWFERGAAYVSRQYKESLESQGNEVFIYARGGEKGANENSNWSSENVYWQKRNDFPIFNYVDDSEFKLWLQKNKIEVVLFNEQIWFEPVITCKNLGIKTGAYIDYYTEEMIPCFDLYDFLLCNTKKHHKAFKHHENALYIPWGTDLELFNQEKEQNNSDQVRFFHSAGMNPHRKGTDLLIRAHLSLPNDYLNKAILIIHTQKNISTNELSQNEITRFDELVQSGKIKIINKTVEAPGLYKMGDVYVYPSRLDGLGLTVAEAKSQSMSIIVPDDGPMNEFAQKNIDKVVEIERYFSRRDGYYWPQNEVRISSLTEALKFYIDNNSKLEEYGEQSRQYALSNFNWMNNSCDLSDYIKNIVTKPVNKKAVNSCISFNERKFPKIYKYKTLYRLAFKIYNSTIRNN